MSPESRPFNSESKFPETMDTPERRANFRVSIFGTGGDKTRHDLAAVSLADKLTTEIVGKGQHKIVTGGYEKGIMGAAAEAAYRQAQESGRNDLLADGITVGSALGKPSERATITETATLPERLHHLIDNSNAVVVLHGKTGTTVELLNALWTHAIEDLKNRANKDYTPKPIIVTDSSLEHADLLSSLEKKDPKKFRMAINDVYILHTDPNSQEPETAALVDNINKIIEIYYGKTLQIEPTAEEQELLDKFRLKKFLDAKESFEGGAGI